MVQNYSNSEYLIRLLYNETTISESLALEGELEVNPNLKQEFQNFSAAMRRLDKVRCKPSPSSLRIIMDHSRKGQLRSV